MSDYHIIGDIHAQADKLEQLLVKLGFKLEKNCYVSDVNDKIVFLGDFIDSDTGSNCRVIEIVKNMVENEQALAVMGNHEFNAICYHTSHPNTGDPLREHSNKNKNQHLQFLNEFPLGSRKANEVIEWFKTLPLFLELETSINGNNRKKTPNAAQEKDRNCKTIRFVHACWDKKLIKKLKDQLGYPALLNEDFLIQAATEATPEFHAIETILKGPEIELPEGKFFLDGKGNKRKNIRYKWWSQGQTYKEIALVPPNQESKIPDEYLPGYLNSSVYPSDAPPVFFGHYWMAGEIRTQSHNVACMDFSVSKGGPLVAYTWHNRQVQQTTGQLSQDNFTSSQ